MIKAKITSKTGASLEWELPANSHELHHALTEMGIRKTPRSILLTDDNAAEVEFTADSEIGGGLLRVFSKGDTLADATSAIGTPPLPLILLRNGLRASITTSPYPMPPRNWCGLSSLCRSPARLTAPRPDFHR